MNYKELAVPYLDASGLMAPSTVPLPKPVRSSDNGTMYLSEFHILLELLGQSTPEDKQLWEETISKCMLVPGLLERGADKNGDQDQQDNALGVLAAAVVLKRPDIAEEMLDYGIRNLGFFNDQVPGTFFNKSGGIAWNAFLWRMPQLFFFTLCAANKYRWYKFWYWPLALFTALVIGSSSMNKVQSDTDARRLGWLAMLVTQDSSLLCKLAGKFFMRCIKKDYGESSMMGVYFLYYQTGHVLIKMMGEYVSRLR